MFDSRKTVVKTLGNEIELPDIDLLVLLQTIRQSRKKTLDSLTFDFVELKLKNIELSKGGVTLSKDVLTSDKILSEIPKGMIHDLMYYLIKDADELLKSLSSSDWETSAQLTQFDNIQTVYLSTYELIKKSLASRLKGASIVQSI